MTLTRTRVRDLLDRYDIRPKRSLGQNFVVEPNTVRRIAELAEVGPGDRVVEIGPGVGSLTLALAETGASVTADVFQARVSTAKRRKAHEGWCSNSREVAVWRHCCKFTSGDMRADD